MQSTKVSYITVDATGCGQRIDNFILRHFRNVPKARIYRAIRGGEVRVDKKRVKQTHRVTEGEEIRVPPITQTPRQSTVVQKHTKHTIKQSILYSDDELIVLNKPSGIAVHGGSGISAGIIEALRQCYPSHQYLELVHRLDRGTSGILLVAKKPRLLRECHHLLREGKVDKEYVLLVSGQWPAGLTTVDAPLKKNSLVGNGRKVTVDPQGKPARSKFEVIKRFSKATLLRAQLYTGRTHQLRVHTAHHGHPIIGDDKYGTNVDNEAFKAQGCSRLFLHAESISFQLPEKPRYHFVADLPQALEKALLGQKSLTQDVKASFKK
jgi:23S rRNA pseudouridine955/2504/2580 synthase